MSYTSDIFYCLTIILTPIFYYMFENEQSQSSSTHKNSETQIKPNNFLLFPEGNLQAKSQVIVNLPVEKDECMQQQNAVLPHIILEKWINFVEFHSIESNDIWEGKLSLPVLLFVDIFQKKLGYRFSISEIKGLSQLAEEQCLRKQHFSKLNLWTKKTAPKNLFSSLATATSHKTLSTAKRKTVQTPKVIVNYRLPSRESYTEKQSFVSQFSRAKTDKSKKLTTFDQITKTFLKLDFTKETPTQDSKLEALRSVMQMNSLEKKWEFIVMAGEMNKWLQEMYKNKSELQKCRPAYKIINQEDTFTIIKSYNGQEEIIPQVVFLKKYNAMKKRVEKQQPKIDVKQIVFANLNAITENNNKGQQNRINHRDRELNQALLQIMRMRNTLEHQYKIFSEAAINT